MKKIIFFGLFILTVLISNAQAPYISVEHVTATQYIGTVPLVDFYTHNFTNEVIETTPTGGNEMIIDLVVENQSGGPVEWIVSRTRIGVDTATWEDFVCWGHSTDPFGGQCIDAVTMDTNFWTGPCVPSYTIDIAAGDSGRISAHIFPNLNESGCGVYRYYVGTCADPFLDSVDISVCYSLGLDEINNQEFSLIVAPNPANNIILLTANLDESMQFELYNSLGQIVESGSFKNTEFIDASTLDDGIYFVTVYGEGSLRKTEKIIINH